MLSSALLRRQGHLGTHAYLQENTHTHENKQIFKKRRKERKDERRNEEENFRGLKKRPEKY